MNDQDKLLNFGSNFDWITPSWAILQDLLNGPVEYIGVMANAGFDRGDIRQLLRQNGVNSWGYIYNVAGDLIMFSVPQEQARRACYILQREGVPLWGAPDEAVEPAKPSRVLDNDFTMGAMEIVPAPSIWSLLKRKRRNRNVGTYGKNIKS